MIGRVKYDWNRPVDGELRAPCVHPDAEPVNLLLTGETVAWLCTECGQQLPAAPVSEVHEVEWHQVGENYWMWSCMQPGCRYAGQRNGHAESSMERVRAAAWRHRRGLAASP